MRLQSAKRDSSSWFLATQRGQSYTRESHGTSSGLCGKTSFVLQVGPVVATFNVNVAATKLKNEERVIPYGCRGSKGPKEGCNSAPVVNHGALYKYTVHY